MLNGRLRSVVTLSNGKKELDREVGRGEMTGVVSIVHLRHVHNCHESRSRAFASSTYMDRIVNIEQGDSKAPCESQRFKPF